MKMFDVLAIFSGYDNMNDISEKLSSTVQYPVLWINV